MKTIVAVTLLAISFAISAPQIEGHQSIISNKIDKLFNYFDFMGIERKIDETIYPDLFTPDFEMIINGKTIVKGRENLTPHFELLLSQVSRVDLYLHEKIVTEDKAIMRYDLAKPGKSTSKVIAIFKFRDGLIYEMNEVVHSVDPSNAIDFTSR